MRSKIYYAVQEVDGTYYGDHDGASLWNKKEWADRCAKMINKWEKDPAKKVKSVEVVIKEATMLDKLLNKFGGIK